MLYNIIKIINNKEKMSQNIKGWLQIDNDIKLLQKEIKDRKKKKIIYTNNLLSLMKSNDIDCVDINDGKIIYSQSNVKKAINKTHLLESLNKYFEKMPNIPTNDIVQYILENREINIKESIIHKPSKNS